MANYVDNGWWVLIFGSNIWYYDIYIYIFNIHINVTIFYMEPFTYESILRYPRDLWALLRHKTGKIDVLVQ